MNQTNTIEAKIGVHAPDFLLPAAAGGNVQLSDYRGKANLVLFFVREFNCASCRTHVTQLGRLSAQFQEAGTQILVILGGAQQEAQEYARLTNAPFPILYDPKRRIYKLYELEKYLLLVQRTASLVVDRGGTIRYLKRTTLPIVWQQESRELLGFVDSLNDGA